MQSIGTGAGRRNKERFFVRRSGLPSVNHLGASRMTAKPGSAREKESGVQNVGMDSGLCGAGIWSRGSVFLREVGVNSRVTSCVHTVRGGRADLS